MCLGRPRWTAGHVPITFNAEEAQRAEVDGEAAVRVRESVPNELLHVLRKAKRASSRRPAPAPAAMQRPPALLLSFLRSYAFLCSAFWPQSYAPSPLLSRPLCSRRGPGIPGSLVCALRRTRRRRPGLRTARPRVPLRYSRHKVRNCLHQVQSLSLPPSLSPS